jgi:hypothetical protein
MAGCTGSRQVPPAQRHPDGLLARDGGRSGAGVHRPLDGRPEVDANGQPVKRKMDFAMVQDIVMAHQLIARRAAEGRDFDAFLRMMADAHHMLQPSKDEGGEGRVPVHAQFVFAPSEPPPP